MTVLIGHFVVQSLGSATIDITIIVNFSYKNLLIKTF